MKININSPANEIYKDQTKKRKSISQIINNKFLLKLRKDFQNKVLSCRKHCEIKPERNLKNIQQILKNF